MEWMKGEYSKLITFVSASSRNRYEQDVKTKTPKANLDGKEVRNFYEDLINDQNATSLENKQNNDIHPPFINQNVKHISTDEDEPVVPSDVSELDINRFLRYSQEGNLQQVKKLLRTGVPINSMDRYGWTALMCASQSGQFDMVKHLLSVGADDKITDRNNKNASDIAKSAGHKHLSKFIRKWKKGKPENDILTQKCDKSEQFYCEVCKCNFTAISIKNHELSMVHLFNSKKKAKDDPFLLPSSNKGYKMMLRSGWDGHKGLGSEGQGQKYPVKTILKRDRKCLGSEKEKKPKITHFNANDKEAVKTNPERKLTRRILNKREITSKQRKHRQWERHLRMSMNHDF